jgi:hypothetical protein
MKNFMALGSFTQGMELNEVPNEGDMMPFPREDAVMTIYDGPPHQGCASCLTRVQEPQLIVAGGAGTQGCKGHKFSNIFVH